MMPDRVEDPRLEEFLTDLMHAENSVSSRAHTAHFIKTHRKELENYIDRKVSLSGANYATVRWAKKIRKTIERREKGPAGYVYDAKSSGLHTLYKGPPQSFRLTHEHSNSLTFASRRRFARLIGYIAIFLCIAATFWLGYVMKKAIEEFGDQWVMAIERAMEPD